MAIQAILSDKVRSRFEFNIKPEKIPDHLLNNTVSANSLIKELISPELPHEIGKIGVKVSSFMQAYSGIELFDRKGNSMFKWEHGLGRWEY